MTPLLGRILIDLALLCAAAGSLVGFFSGRAPTLLLNRTIHRFGLAFALLMAGANVLMVWALVSRDFSISYVAQVGSKTVPTWVAVASLWSSLEGSILFWGLVLAIYIVVAMRSTMFVHAEAFPWASAVWLGCAAFFSFLLAGPAQPFGTMSPVPLDGPGPNPLLQNHLLMVVHPPFLYLGYVGMTIPFGLAIAALLRGSLDGAFIRSLRFWLLLPWIFLTVAIVLGGWWAYEVLGWGGYWAWDPVENASFLPWLTGTAALHSAIVMQRKNVLRGWTVTLVIATYLLTILGTFMTRSGVFNSVHSFTQSAIGPTILVFLAILLVGSVITLSLRIDHLTTDRAIGDPVSRETVFLINNLLFVVFTFTVLIGTVFPLLVEAVDGRQMSVGRPYFDRMAVPIGVALLFFMGIGPALPWGRSSLQQARRAIIPPLAGAALSTAIAAILGVRSPSTLIAIAAGGYTLWVTIRELLRPASARMNEGAAFGDAVRQVRWSRNLPRTGAYLAHLGAVIVIVAIAVSSSGGVTVERQVKRGESLVIGDYTLTYVGADEKKEPNRESTIARLDVMRDGHAVGYLEPRMNFYTSRREPIGTPDVLTTVTHDLYVSLMNIDATGTSAGFLVRRTPMVSWIWGATALMGLGGLMALMPAGMRRRARVETSVRVTEERSAEASS